MQFKSYTDKIYSIFFYIVHELSKLKTYVYEI